MVGTSIFLLGHTLVQSHILHMMEAEAPRRSDSSNNNKKKTPKKQTTTQQKKWLVEGRSHQQY